MAERKKAKKKGQDAQTAVSAEIKPSKLEYAVAHYMKSKVPTKKTKFLSHPVNYFNANKAIDVLLDSPWASGNEILFTDRASVVKFCNKLLEHKFFHRAKKIAVTDKDLRPKELKKKKDKEKDDKPTKKKDEKEEKSKKKEENEQSSNEQDEVKDKDSKKKKTKIRLDMHLNQVFVDGPEAYVWMYDPIPFWYYIAGACLLFAAIAICLFPLWPPTVRLGVYYLSIAAAGFLGVILGLAVLRFIIFVIIWTLSLGRHHFWILPNLTEDVGFFASFWPLYHYEYKGSSSKSSSSKKKSKKDSQQSNNGSESQSHKSDADDALDSQSAAETDADKNVEGQDNSHEEEGSDSEHSNPNSQNFVILDKEEIDEDN